jgi:hypothetical protein
LIKKILLSLASLFLFYQAWEIILGWSKIQNVPFGIAMLWAFLTNLFVLGAFAFAGFAWPSERLLPEVYYFVKSPKKLLRINKSIGVPFFQNFLLLTFWRSKKKQKEYFDGTKSGIGNWINESKKAEFGHLIPFIILTTLSIWSVYLGNYLLAVLTQLLNVLANLYPVLLQRTHRARIQRVFNRMK